jgi:hypothetical protein
MFMSGRLLAEEIMVQYPATHNPQLVSRIPQSAIRNPHPDNPDNVADVNNVENRG